MRHFLVPMLAACLWLTPSCGKAQDGGKKPQGSAIAVIDFGYVDTSGEERDQRKESMKPGSATSCAPSGTISRRAAASGS